VQFAAKNFLSVAAKKFMVWHFRNFECHFMAITQAAESAVSGIVVDHKLPGSVKLSYGQRSHLEGPRESNGKSPHPCLIHNDCVRACVSVFS